MIVDRLVLQNLVALDRMRFDHIEFLVGQTIRFFDDRIGNAELANIMKQTAKCRKLNIFLRKMQPAGKNITDQGNIQTMRVGKIIVSAHIVEHVKEIHTSAICLQKLQCVIQHGRYIDRSTFFYDIIDLILEIDDRCVESFLKFMELRTCLNTRRIRIGYSWLLYFVFHNADARNRIKFKPGNDLIGQHSAL